MRSNSVLAAALAAVLAACGGSTPAPELPAPSEDRFTDADGRLLRIGEPVHDAITEEDPTWGTNGRFHLYRFQARAGERLALEMSSEEFDTYLVVGDRAGGIFNPIAQDDDGGGDLDARIRFVAPSTGTYWILAQAYAEYGVGSYMLELAQLPAPRPVSATPIAVGSSSVAELSDDDPVQEDDDSHFDLYTFPAVEGQRYAINMSSTAFDTYLHVGVGTTDFEEITSDDDGGDGTDSRVVLTAERSGTYSIQATAFAADATGEYSLSVTELAPPGPLTVSPIAIGRTVTGTLENGDQVGDDGSWHDYYSFTGEEGQRISILMRASDFDSYLEVGELEDGEFSGEYSDDDGGGNLDSRIVTTLPRDGLYVVRTSSLDPEDGGMYTLVVETMAPPGPPTVRPISIGQNVTGSLDPTDAMLDDGSHYDIYTVRGTAGQRIRVILRSGEFDSYLAFGRWLAGELEVTESDDDSAGGLDSQLEITLPSTGEFAIRANSLNSSELGAYTLSVEAL